MLRRIFNLVLLVAMLIGAAITYDMKHKAEMAADRVAKLQADIAKQKDAIALLRAEWSLLTQPARLQDVVEKYSTYFKLEPFSPKQLATIDEIPLRPVPQMSPIDTEIARSAADPMTTGGIQ
jgi:hypothetical protein